MGWDITNVLTIYHQLMVSLDVILPCLMQPFSLRPVHTICQRTPTVSSDILQDQEITLVARNSPFNQNQRSEKWTQRKTILERKVPLP
ncbi:hypothetical protein TNCV_3008681 [Trichonephila clavipes]|nr:hypothetical protein TNCV_3008681 [Trichonephila clavipes]